MIIKHLFISFGEVLRITQNGDNVKFLICDDDIAMKEVNAGRFGEYMKSLENVCMRSWNKQLAEDYKDIESFYEMVRES